MAEDWFEKIFYNVFERKSYDFHYFKSKIKVLKATPVPKEWDS